VSSPITITNRVISIAAADPRIILDNGDTIAIALEAWQTGVVGEIEALDIAGARLNESIFYAFVVDQSALGATDRWASLANLLVKSGILPGATSETAKTWLASMPQAATRAALKPYWNSTMLARLNSDLAQVSALYYTPPAVAATAPYADAHALFEDLNDLEFKLAFDPVAKVIRATATNA